MAGDEYSTRGRAERGAAGEDRGGLRRSVAEEELHLVSSLVSFPEDLLCHRVAIYILYILRGVVD